MGSSSPRERLDAVGAFSFDGEFSGSLPARRTRDHQAWVQISVGCNCVCAYCIVPTVRGRERSRPLADILREITALVADGVREVTLLGQNVNSYGRDLPKTDRATFAELLRAVAAVDGLWRVRYTSPHPKDMKPDVIAAMADCPEVCNHLHLPVQSGSTRVLKTMRRTYSRERYLDLVERLKAAIPDISLTTDLIVGFPGETEDDFEQSLSLVRECDYDGAYTFVYSERPGTLAAMELVDDVSAEVKKDRIVRLVELVQERARARAARFVGTTGEVLVEGPSRTDPHKQRGRLSQNIAVNFSGEAAPGMLVPVRIELGDLHDALGPGGGGCGPRLSTTAFSLLRDRPRAAKARWSTRSRCDAAARLSSRTPFSGTEALKSLPMRHARRSWRRCATTASAISSLRERSTAADFSVAAHHAIDGCMRAERLPVVSGGTGLYLRAALTDLQFPAPEQPETRSWAEQLSCH